MIWKIFKNQYFWLTIILILGLAVRLIKIDSPIADWHSWRQADTAAVTRNFIQEGFNPLYPKYDDMAGFAQNPIINIGRFRFVEFPLYNIIVYPFYLLFGINTVWHRLVSVFFSLGSIILIFLLARKYESTLVALFSGLFFSLLPFSVYFSRTTLPEPTFIFFSLGMVYFLDNWIYKNKNFWLTLLFSICAFLVKPYAIFFMLPLIYSAVKKDGPLWFLRKRYPVMLVLIFLPLIFWRLWILQHPEGIPASGWLYNGDNIRFHPAFWWWILSDRIGREILGVAGTTLFFLGLILKSKKGNYFLQFFALSSLSFLVIFATGNVKHNYYQTLIVPALSIFAAKGLVGLLEGGSQMIPRFWTIALGLFLLPLTFYFPYTQVKGFYQVNNNLIIIAGEEANRVLPKDAVVIAPYGGDSAFLYQINRVGFGFTPLPIPELISNYGVTNYVSINKDDKTNWVKRHFKIIEETNDFVIADLTKVTSPLTLEDKEP